MFHSIRRTSASFVRALSDFPAGCGWETILENAKSKREPPRLDNTEECGTCIPLPETRIEPTEDITNLTPINGVPCDAYSRNVAIIQKRAKSCMQSGTANTHAYILSYMNDVTWENPLMGWTSGSNSLKDVEIPFPNLESAVLYAARNGWDFIVPKEKTEKKMQKKNYALNFSWNRRTRKSTK